MAGKTKKVIKKYYRPRGKWSANIKTLTAQTINANASSSFFSTSDLCANPIQVESTVSQQYTVKNIELSYEIETDNFYYIEGLTAYIMYVPQGMTITETYPNQHPEYIMAYRFLGSPNRDEGTTPNRLPSRIKTRLARRLQTGDKIVLLIVGLNEYNSAQTLKFNGLIRWWTKAN